MPPRYDCAMLTVGLTGNIAAGKSTVAAQLVARGATLIDADVLARDAVATGSPALATIIQRWGRGVLAPDGSLDRAALRQIVFADERERAALNAIVHPEVERRRVRATAAARAAGTRILVVDIPLLFEAKREGEVDTILLVDAPEAVRRERLIRHRGLSAAEADAMLAAQLPSGPKRARADYVIDNDGSPEELAARVDAVWAALLAASAPTA
jgi:dephospho-CoA kinase